MPHVIARIRRQTRSPQAQAVFKRMLFALAEIVVTIAIMTNYHRFIPAPESAEMRSLYDDCQTTIASCRKLEQDLKQASQGIDMLQGRIPPPDSRYEDARRAAWNGERDSGFWTIGRWKSFSLAEELSAAQGIKSRIKSDQCTRIDERCLREFLAKSRRYHDALESFSERQVAFVRSVCDDPILRDEVLVFIPVSQERFWKVVHTTPAELDESKVRLWGKRRR